MKNPLCPKCGKKMARGRPSRSTGKFIWDCRGPRPDRIHCYSTTRPDLPATGRNGRELVNRRAPVFDRALKRGTKTFIITAAQNATPVHAGFWDCLLTARKALKAELLVVPIRYKNPTSRWASSQRNDETWDYRALPYLWNTRVNLNKNLTLLGDIKTQPTAVDATTGFESITGSSSAILGHTKLRLRTIAAPANKMAKLITTTGACTVENYTDSGAGKKGEFHHVLAAVLVEIDGPIFHLRHINYDVASESFIDLDKRYSRSVVVPAPRPLALVMGDTHVDFIDPVVERATDEMTAVLRPRYKIWHDLNDTYSANPHHAGNPFNAIAKRQSGADEVEAEVERAIRYVADHTPRDVVSIVVASNHDDFLRRWIISNDWRSDPTNAAFYLETALAMVRGTRLGSGGTEYPSPFPYWFKQAFPNNPRFRCLGYDESFVLGGVELSLHGDRGPNGARGSAHNLRRIGVKSIVGHSHTPQIDEGCYQVGTSTRLRLEYNGGPSSWLNAHCLLHSDGKRQLIIIVSNKRRGTWRK